MARKKIKTFEDSIERINQIIVQMEQETLDFNKNLDLYHEALNLINDCSNQIDTAQQKVSQLNDDFSLKNFDKSGE